MSKHCSLILKPPLIYYCITGLALEGSFYKHPLSSKSLPVLPGHHVSSTIGTGFVHIAPAHGPDDFLVALEHNIPIVGINKFFKDFACNSSNLG